MFGLVAVVPFVLTYALATPGLVYLRRRGLVARLAWWLPLAAIGLWWLLYASGFGHAEAYNVVELAVVAIVVALGIDLCAVIVMPVVRVWCWWDLAFWSAPLAFVIVLRLVAPGIGE